jgi:hypothetical protein
MSKATGDLLSYFDAKEMDGSPPRPSWNVAPTQDVPIVTEKLAGDELNRRLLIARWGLVPSWAKDIKIGSKLINARSETLREKPSFRKGGNMAGLGTPAPGTCPRDQHLVAEPRRPPHAHSLGQGRPLQEVCL